MQTARESISTALAARVVRGSSAGGACTVKSAMRDATSSGGEETVWVDIRRFLLVANDRLDRELGELPLPGGERVGVRDAMSIDSARSPHPPSLRSGTPPLPFG